jgi:hypothetical protein
MKEPEAEIKRLIELGYLREDIQVLANGSVTIVPHDEFESTARMIARATAPDRLKKIRARVRELDQLALSPSGRQPEEDEEYLRLKAEIKATLNLVRRC